jgi:hypothetical protein
MELYHRVTYMHSCVVVRQKNSFTFICYSNGVPELYLEAETTLSESTQGYFPPPNMIQWRIS